MDCKMHPDLVTGFQKKKTRTEEQKRPIFTYKTYVHKVPHSHCDQ